LKFFYRKKGVFFLPSSFIKNKLSVEGVKYKMKNEAGLKHRLPREHSEFRNRINAATDSHLQLKNSYDKYIEYKNLIDLKYVEKVK
jgi:hypothetical protein